MAKIQLLETWPAGGNMLLPGGTIIDANDPQFHGQPLPWPIAKALDQEALDTVAFWAGEENYPKLCFAPGLKLPALGYPPFDPDEVVSETRRATAQRKQVEDWLASLEMRYGPTNGRIER
jgi:hypothetical protein